MVFYSFLYTWHFRSGMFDKPFSSTTFSRRYLEGSFLPKGKRDTRTKLSRPELALIARMSSSSAFLFTLPVSYVCYCQSCFTATSIIKLFCSFVISSFRLFIISDFNACTFPTSLLVKFSFLQVVHYTVILLSDIFHSSNNVLKSRKLNLQLLQSNESQLVAPQYSIY